MARKRVAGGLVVTIVMLSLLGCPKNLKYEPQIQKAQLLELKGKRLAVLPIAYDDKAMLTPAHIAMEVRKAALESQAAGLREAFAQLFQVVPVTTSQLPASTLETSRIDAQSAKQAANLVNVDAVLWVRTALDFDMDVLRTQVENYSVASELRLYDRAGRLVWSYYSKGTGGPSLKEVFSPTGFMRGIVALDPAQQTQVLNFSRILKQHSAFVVWLLNNQINDRPERNYVTQYPKYDKRVMISSADAPYAPLLTDAN